MFKIIICILAGLGAGLGTGFAGMSAAAVISPMLITFLHMDPYLAVGIALASDVLASAASAYTYGKNKNLDIKNGVIMMISVLCFTLVGSYIASIVPKATMGSFSTLMTLFLGIKFIVKPVLAPKQRFQSATARQKAIRSVLCGAMVGFICVISTLVFAQVAALFANKASPIVLNRVTGSILVILGVAILAVNYFG